MRNHTAALRGRHPAASACLSPSVAACFPPLTAPQTTLRLPAVLWITGLPAAGKTTLAGNIHAALLRHGTRSVVVDADVLRRTLNADLGYTDADRRENVRRIGELARFLLGEGFTPVIACISPFRDQREALRRSFAPGQFLEIFADTPLEICRQRDPKGLYQRAQRGELKQLTGLDSAYEPPVNPDLVFKPDGFNAGEFTRRFGLPDKAHARAHQA